MSDDGTETNQDAPDGAHAGNAPHQPHHAGPKKSRSGCSCGGLIVIGVLVLIFLGLIDWLLFPFGNRGYDRKKNQTRPLTKSIVNAIKAYYAEYSHYESVT